MAENASGVGYIGAVYFLIMIVTLFQFNKLVLYQNSQPIAPFKIYIPTSDFQRQTGETW